MHGVIFTKLSDMAIDTWGMEFWNRILDEVSPENGGAYTTAVQYSDQELFDIAAALSKATKTPTPDLIRSFGCYLFKHLMDYCPVDVGNEPGVISFLSGINDIVHAEVLRVHPEAYVPFFGVSEIEADKIELIYKSERKLCALCEGLIQGAADYFNQKVQINHPVCMHSGGEHCLLQVSVLSQRNV